MDEEEEEEEEEEDLVVCAAVVRLLIHMKFQLHCLIYSFIIFLTIHNINMFSHQYNMLFTNTT